MATVNTTDPKPGFVYNADDDTWYPLLGIATQSLDGLTDVIITSPTSGQTVVYNGTNWVNTAETGDISGVTAGTGLSGGGTSGAVTVSIDTSVTADLTTAQTLTNKTLTDPKINLAFDPETASYTAILANNGQVVTMNVSSGNTFSIPTNASVAFPIGTQITVLQIGTGQTTIQAVTSGTTTVLSTGATAAQPKLRVRYSAATCVKAGTDLWYVFGDIS
jgi:hypothetical protein